MGKKIMVALEGCLRLVISIGYGVTFASQIMKFVNVVFNYYLGEVVRGILEVVFIVACYKALEYFSNSTEVEQI